MNYYATSDNSFNISRIVATNSQLTIQYKTYKYNQSTNNTNVYEILLFVCRVDQRTPELRSTMQY
ncbi:unnamed protein product, partial [Schistosoma rodhaini]